MSKLIADRWQGVSRRQLGSGHTERSHAEIKPDRLLYIHKKLFLTWRIKV